MLVVFKFERNDACRLFFRHYYEILEYEKRMNLANPPPLPAENNTSSDEQNNNNNPITKTTTTTGTATTTNTDRVKKEETGTEFVSAMCWSNVCIKSLNDLSK